MIAGVCGGLGRYFDVNPVFYRVGFVILTLLGGAGILVYGAAVLVIPNEGEEESIASDTLRNHRQRPLAIVGLALVALAGVSLLSHISFQVHSDLFWVLVLIGGALLLRAQRRDKVQTVTAADGTTTVVVERRRRGVLGMLLIGVGVLLAAAIAAVVAFASVHLHLGDGVGEHTYHVASADDLRSDYRLGVGNLDLNLSELSLPAGVTTVHAHLGIGNLHVIVQRGVTVRTKAHVSWGDTTLLGHEEQGHDVRVDVGSKEPQLVLDTVVGIGHVDVDRSVR